MIIKVALISILCYLANGMDISFWLGKKQTRCFGDSYTIQTLVRGQLRSTSLNVTFSIFDGNGNKLFTKSNEEVIVFTFTSQDTTIHQFCIENHNEKEIKLGFTIVFGVTASDESLLLKKTDIKGMEFYFQHLKENIQRMKIMQMYILERDNSKIGKADFILTSLWIMSVISIVILIAVFFIQRRLIINYFKSKKNSLLIRTTFWL